MARHSHAHEPQCVWMSVASVVWRNQLSLRSVEELAKTYLHIGPPLLFLVAMPSYASSSQPLAVWFDAAHVRVLALFLVTLVGAHHLFLLVSLPRNDASATQHTIIGRLAIMIGGREAMQRYVVPRPVLASLACEPLWALVWAVTFVCLSFLYGSPVSWMYKAFMAAVVGMSVLRAR